MKGFTDDRNYVVELLEGRTTIADVIENHIYEQALAEKNAFLVANLGALMRQHVVWQSTMPLVRPFYPVKCNRSPAVIEILAALGVGFVCSNKSELSMVLNHEVPTKNIILSGVCKQLSHIKYAAKNGINYLVCDNEAELCKIARAHPNAKLLLQLSTEAEAEEASMVFGCSLKSGRHLLETARKLGMDVIGVVFQVPSSKDPQVYTHALADACCVFDMAEELGFHMEILDIGGGFSTSEIHLKQTHAALVPLLEAHFPVMSAVHIIAEPGTFYVSSCFTLAVNVIGKKVVARDPQGKAISECYQQTSSDEPEFLYYLNEGVYGSFVGKLLGNTVPSPTVHKVQCTADEPWFFSSLWGPSFDLLDQVVECCLLPELTVGDWLIFKNMGASGQEEAGTICDANKPPVYYAISTGDWFEMHKSGISLDNPMKNFSLVQYGL